MSVTFHRQLFSVIELGTTTADDDDVTGIVRSRGITFPDSSINIAENSYVLPPTKRGDDEFRNSLTLAPATTENSQRNCRSSRQSNEYDIRMFWLLVFSGRMVNGTTE